MSDPLSATLDFGRTLVDKLFPDKDEANRLKATLTTMALNGELEEFKARVDVIVAEANGASWLQRNWRPLTMLWFSALIGMYWFGYAPDYLTENPELVQELFELIKLGLGGYVIGRSAEKIADKWNPLK